MPRPNRDRVIGEGHSVVESPSGMRHAYTSAYGSMRTLCGRSVPRFAGWFGPIADKDITCARCREHADA